MKLAFESGSSIPDIVKSLQRRRPAVVSLTGLTSPTSKAFVLRRLKLELKSPLVVVTNSNGDVEDLATDLVFFGEQFGDAEAGVMRFPSFETDIYSSASPHAETLERRALTLWNLAQSRPDFLVMSARAMIMRTLPPAKILELGAVIERGKDYPEEVFVSKLITSGYVREDPISNIGQFSVRGGIIDVWSPDAPNPVRIEFFGDTVESIREFDPDSQLSTGQVSSAAIAPMRDLPAVDRDFKAWASAVRKAFPDEKFARNIKDRTDFADQGESFPGWEFLFPILRPLESSVFDYLDDCVFVIDEPSTIERNLTDYYEALSRRFTQKLEQGDIAVEPGRLFIDPSELGPKLDGITRLEMRALGLAAAGTDEEFEVYDERLSSPLFLFPSDQTAREFEIISRSTRKFHGNIEELASGLAKTDSTHTYFVLQSTGLAERVTEILNEYELPVSPGSVLVGRLSGGFEIPLWNLTVYSESDIFGEIQHPDVSDSDRRQQTRKSKLGAFISDFRDLKSGDFVVHVDHGVGRFETLQTINSQGVAREFMLLVYADDAKLFVPVERMDLVSRYSSGEATSPSLDRLGGLGWQKTKAKAKRAMRDMADELLKLYAERKLVRGYAFGPDAPWQHEFEDAFPYDLTVDQVSAISDVKTDMETPSPMDRLIIGDVGYGKTEVAMRAAFKAVMDGKQVAVLTPTTVLAYQHFETFAKRFAAFPVKVDLLSRFRNTREQKAVVESAKKGDTDVVIGTHRILSGDVAFNKLGLVVVDEEQRFGVAHKEKLKRLKKTVDVLTLSATPIPRTLNMSLLGMRDMSVIETPPRDRLAINTQVVQFSEGVIRSAIEVELARNGQVFFIHNRVETIEAIAALVQRIVPNARIAIGHGQMNEKEMEQVMLDFIDYKYDILVATTIIENGIDIPRANTIIINRADNYGLSQLYQLRGRVGRSNRRAYAYLLIPSEIELTPIARRRLSAIREFSDLGAGFRLAALDLELRGAGNILGGQQSGHLDALGFDLYTKMLERTIAELRGDEVADETSVTINPGVDVSIPKDYISDTSQRLRAYKRISSAESDSALAQIYAEVRDRYGEIPESVENLFEYGRLRRLAERTGVISIDKTSNGFAIKLSENAKISPDKLMSILGKNGDASFSPTGILRVEYSGNAVLTEARKILNEIAD